MSFPIPEPIALALAAAGPELIHGVVELVKRVVSSPDPKDALARALQVLAHEKAADAAVDALFAAKSRLPNTGG